MANKQQQNWEQISGDAETPGGTAGCPQRDVDPEIESVVWDHVYMSWAVGSLLLPWLLARMNGLVFTQVRFFVLNLTLLQPGLPPGSTELRKRGLFNELV